MGTLADGHRPNGAIIRLPGEGRELTNPIGAPTLIRLLGEETGGAYSILEAEQPADGPRAPIHVHSDEDETIYVLEGTMMIEAGHERVEAPAGSLVMFPRGVSQHFWNEGPGRARYLAIYSPPGAEGYVLAVDELDREADDFPKRLAEVRARYGLSYPDVPTE